MNNSQIDHLLQLPGPRPEAGSSHARPREDAPAFDDHIRRASDTSAPPPAAPAPSRQPAADDQRRSTHAEERPTKPAGNADSQPSAQSETPPASVAKAAGADDSQVKEKEEDRDQDDAHADRDAEVAALLAAADQLAKNVENPTDAKLAGTSDW